MKQNLGKVLKGGWMALVMIFFNVLAIAQEKAMDINVDVNKGVGNQWYANPWAWIIGAAIFILLLVAIVRGGRTSD